MNTTHTPGPWTLNDHDRCIWPARTAARRAPIATVFLAVQPESELSQECDAASREEQANASLIAAAPELLSALEEIASRSLLVVCKEGESGQAFYILNAARAAIAKATGTL